MKAGDWVYYTGPHLIPLRTGEEWGEVQGFRPTGVRVSFPFVNGGGTLWITLSPEFLRTEEEQMQSILGEDYA